MAKNKGLGRGLDAIFDNNSLGEAHSEGTTNIRISKIEPKRDQPRKLFDTEALAQLADSIAANGVLQPILVRKTENDMYSIIAGERRWRASKLAGLNEIPAIVLDTDDFSAAKIAMIENLQRENLNPCEEALGYADLIKNYSLTQEEISAQIGKSRSAVANSLRLLELPDEILALIANGSLTAGHGRALLGLRDRSNMISLAERAAARKLSVREVEATVRASNRQDPANKMPSAKVDYVTDLEEKVSSILGRRCKILLTPKKKTIQFDFSSDDDLDSFLVKLCGKPPIDD